MKKLSILILVFVVALSFGINNNVEASEDIIPAVEGIELTDVEIDYFYPQVVKEGTLVQISGSNFDYVPAEFKVGETVIDEFLYWEDEMIFFRVPEGVESGSSITVGDETTEETIEVVSEDCLEVTFVVDDEKANEYTNENYEEYDLEDPRQIEPPLFIKGQWTKFGEDAGNFSPDWDGGERVQMFNNANDEWIIEIVFTSNNLETYEDELMRFALEDTNEEDRTLSSWESDAANMIKLNWAANDPFTDIDSDPAVNLINLEENEDYYIDDNTLRVKF